MNKSFEDILSQQTIHPKDINNYLEGLTSQADWLLRA
jgi:hypothetical protein